MTKSKRYLKNSVKLVLLFSLLFSFSNCTRKEPPYKRGEVEERIIGAFKKDINIDVITKVTADTLHIYIPLKEELLHVIRSSAPPKKDISFFYADCAYKEDIFSIKYAAESIPLQKQFMENVTYNLTEYASNIMNKAYYLMQTALTDSKEHFDFFVVYMADTKNGIEMILTIQETDLKNFFGMALPFAEFNQRVIRQIRGDRKIIGDATARHIEFKGIEMKDFICDLVIQRLLYSNFESNKIDSIQEEILKIFYITVASYGFDEYEEVRLLDILNNTEELLFRYKIEEVYQPLIREK